MSGSFTRHKVPKGTKALPERLLEMLQQRPLSIIEMYNEFPEYKYNSISSAIKSLRDRGHDILGEKIGETGRGMPITKYTLVPPKT